MIYLLVLSPSICALLAGGIWLVTNRPEMLAPALLGAACLGILFAIVMLAAEKFRCHA